jgi:acetyltransferase-like isoleucine patch superfamily enzyme
VIEIVLTREDANTEFALLSEWTVADGEEVRKGQLVCVVETSKASIEVEAPAAGTLVHLFVEGAEVEPGRTIAIVATSAEALVAARERRDRTEAPSLEPAPGRARATRKAVELAELHGIDLASIEKAGFVTAEDVEALVALETGAVSPVLAGASTAGVTLPASIGLGESVGAVDPAFLDWVRADPDAIRALSTAERCAAYREAGALIDEGVVLEEGVLIDAPRLVIEERARIGRGATIRCDEVVAIGAVTHFGPGLELTCRRAFVGAGVHAGRAIRVGGGGHRDPWATFAVGDLTFIGDEVFINPCRPVLLGSEVYLTMRAMVVTHNIGHSALEGYENRFAPVVLEDRSQVGLGAVVYAGCRIGRGAIVASNSYVVSDIPADALAIGVPARVEGKARHELSRPRQVARARRIVDDLSELLHLRGHEVGALEDDGLHGFAVDADGRRSVVIFAERVENADEFPAAPAGTVILTLAYAGEGAPDGYAVVDLLARRLYGRGGVVLDSVREFCRKQGIRLAPGPWRYPGGLI